jgi:hypothetical protein
MIQHHVMEHGRSSILDVGKSGCGFFLVVVCHIKLSQWDLDTWLGARALLSAKSH